MIRSLATLSGITAGALLLGMGVATAQTKPENSPAPTILHCPTGNTEDSCIPDYIGNGNWRLLPLDGKCDSEDASPEWFADGDCVEPN